MFYWLIKAIAWPVVRVYFRFRSLLTGRVPRRGPCIVVANHTSYLDAICLGSACPRKLRFLINHEIYAMLRLRWFYYMMDAIPLRSGSADTSALRRALHVLKDGGAVAIFPEGQRMQDGRVGEGKLGVAFLAARSGAPVIPAAIVGAHAAMPVGATVPRPFRIHVVFGDPMILDVRSRRPAREDLEDFADGVMKAIAALGAPPAPRDASGIGAPQKGSA